MRVLGGMFVVGLIVMTVIVATVIDMFVRAAPYVLVVLVVVALVRHVGRRRPAEEPLRQVPVREVSARRVGATSPSGWVLVAVWVGPRAAPVVDAEVMDGWRGQP